MVAKEPLLEYAITYPPFGDEKHLVFGRGRLEGKLCWGYEPGSGDMESRLVTTDLFDINQPHVGSFQQTRTGKSTLAGSVMLQVAFQGIPVIVVDPKPDYVANMIPITKTIDFMPDLRERIIKRFNEVQQDPRGFDLSKPVDFELHGKKMKLLFMVYSFDKELRGLPNCKVLKLPFVVLPSLEDPDFQDHCNAIATGLAVCLPSSRGKGYNVILSEVIRTYKTNNPREEFMLYSSLLKEIENFSASTKHGRRRIEGLIAATMEFYTANSYLYANDLSELVKIDDLVKNPDYADGDGRTVSMSVIDVSQLPQEENNPILLNYVSQLCGQLLNLVRRKKTGRPIQAFVVFDEAQNYLPDPSELYNYVRAVITRGASLGIKAWLIAQSPQAVEKEARKQFTTLILSKVNQSSVRDEASKFVQNEDWITKLSLTDLGKVLVLNQSTASEGGKLCATFTTPQTVDILVTKQIAELSAVFRRAKVRVRETKHHAIAPKLSDSTVRSFIESRAEVRGSNVEKSAYGLTPLIAPEDLPLAVERKRSFPILGEEETVTGIQLVYRPIVEVGIRIRTGLFKRKFHTKFFLLDGITGRRVELGNRLVFQDGLERFLGLNIQHVQVLKALDPDKNSSLFDVASRTGISRNVMRRLVDSLEKKRLVGSSKLGRTKVVRRLVDLPRIRLSETSVELERVNTSDSSVDVIKVKEAEIRDVVKGLLEGSDVERFKPFFYPLYRVELSLKRKRRKVWVDGRRGESLTI